MSLLTRLFGTKTEVAEKSSGTPASTPEFDRLLAFGGALMRLLNEDRFIFMCFIGTLKKTVRDNRYLSLHRCDISSNSEKKNK